MIKVTRFDGEPIVLNADLIEHIEATPDTVISLTTGRKVLVKETVAQVVGRVIAYERSIRIGARFRKRRYGHVRRNPLEGDS